MDIEDSAVNPPALPSLPQYPELILAAIESVNDKNGASKLAISKYIESVFGILPAAHSTLLSLNLGKMKMNGQIMMVRSAYMKTDPNAPPRRGRGRPPKPRDPAEMVSPSSLSGRKRGRPRKVEEITSDPAAVDGNSPGTKVPDPAGDVISPRGRGRPPKEKTSTVTAPSKSGRKRGRPFKAACGPLMLLPVEVYSPPRSPWSPLKPEDQFQPVPVNSLPRGRGRPPKPKDQFQSVPVNSLPRGRGRPPKPKDQFKPVPVYSAPHSRGRPPKPKEQFPPVYSAPRSRGRPLKPKDQFPPVYSQPRSRGRPPKPKDQFPPAEVSQKRPRGRQPNDRKLVSLGSSPGKQAILSITSPNTTLHRGRGRPRKPLGEFQSPSVISQLRPRGRPPKERLDPVSSSRMQTTTSKTFPNTSQKRGRGRPPKSKEQFPVDMVNLSPRPRGCPPKDRDPVSEATPSISGKKRGRPVKVKNTASELADVVV